MRLRLFLALAALIAGSGDAWSQQAAPAPAAPTGASADRTAPDAAAEDEGDFADESLDVLLAPVALLPDPLLVAVLQSSIVPVDVIAASQFLDGYETDKSLQPDPDWDPAVIGLLGFPTILHAMASNMDWVEATGDAVLDDLDGVQASIQQDRAEFHAAGVLESDDKQNVIVDADTIRIEPVDPKVIYLPIYDAAQLMDAIRSGDAGLAAQPPAEESAAAEAPAAPAPQGDTASADAAARAEAAAQEARDAAAASQQASEQSQSAAQQSQAAAEQSQAAASQPPPQAAAEVPGSSVALPAEQAAPMAYAPPPVTYAAPVTYAPPAAYADSSSSEVWSTVGTFAGGALVGGLLGYALGDDDDDDDHHDGWWDDDDDIDIDEDDLEDYLDDRRRDREDAREDWQGFADEAREDRQSAVADRQRDRQDTAGERQQARQEGRTDREADRQASRTERQGGRQASASDRRDDRTGRQEARREDVQGARADRQVNRQAVRDDNLRKQRSQDIQARLGDRAQTSRQPLSAREAPRSPSPVGKAARPAAAKANNRTPQLDLSGKKAKPAATASRPQARIGSTPARAPSSIAGMQRGQTTKKQELRGASSRQAAASRKAPSRQVARPSAPSRQASRPPAPSRQVSRVSAPSRQVSRPAQHKAVKPGGRQTATAHGNRGKASRRR